MFRQTLGIMTTRTIGEPPFGSHSFYRQLCLAGKRAGLDVFVFTPQDIDWLSGTAECYSYNDWSDRRGQWLQRRRKFPDAVYDRCFFTRRIQAETHRTAASRLQEEFHVLFLGCGLKGKWSVQRMLEQDSRFSGYLPQTEVMRSLVSVASWLRLHGQVLLKPQAGSQGRGVLLVQRTGAAAVATTMQLDGAQRSSTGVAAYTVRGRDRRNRRIARGFADEAALLLWLRRFTARRSYLLQQYLLLQMHSGDAYDVRALVQKDGSGRWAVTGTAVRRGQDGSLTSNLHGGGIAQPTGGFLANQFTPVRAASIMAELLRLSELIPEALEACHGRLVELGIDYGIDTAGHIWILEVNSKPGRSIFANFYEGKTQNYAITNPIRYARYLLLKPKFPKTHIHASG